MVKTYNNDVHTGGNSMDNTFSVDTSHLDARSSFLADHVALNLIDQGFSRIWLLGQAPDAFSGDVQLVFAGTQWTKGRKRQTEKPEARFVTGLSWDHGRSVNSVKLSSKPEKASTLPFDMAIAAAKGFSHRIVFVVAK